ncbi:MAG: hypothetical protein U0V74_16895 [Chitinophagales bacterium]
MGLLPKVAKRKKIPDATIHEDSLRVFVSLFPYVIAQERHGIYARLLNWICFWLLKGQMKYWKEMNRSFKMMQMLMPRPC